jgi:hypothetical protein
MKGIFLLIFCTLLFTGCVSGSRCSVTAHSVAQPVSCTPYVYDASGKIVEAQPQDLVRHVMLKKTSWSMWFFIPLNSRNWDVSKELNTMLQKTPGNAMVNVTVTVQSCDGFQNYLATYLPLIPCYVHVVVQGDIVKIPAS